MDKNLEREIEDFVCSNLDRDGGHTTEILTLETGQRLLLYSYSCDHVGGLEGFYSDTFEGTVYVDNEAYYFKCIDVFCSETYWELEREPDEDFISGDEEYLGVFKRRCQPSITLGEPEEPKINRVEQPSAFFTIKDMGSMVMVDNHSNNHTIQVSKKGVGEYGVAIHHTPDATIKSVVVFGENEGQEIVDNKETNIDNTTEQTNGIIKEFKMSNSRQVRTVILIDEHKDIKDENSIVAKFDDIVSSKPDNALLMDIAVKHNIQESIDQYNETRTKVVDREILRNTGREVFLEPVEIDDLRWLVK